MRTGEKLGWFKFNPTLWMFDRISLESLEIQGLYINVLCLYWIREGDLDSDMLIGRFPKQRENLEHLIDNDYLELGEDGYVTIDFLDREINAAYTRIEKGKNAAKKRWKTKAE